MEIKVLDSIMHGALKPWKLDTTLAKIESDVIQNPSLQTITKIADGLDITIDDLIKI